MPWVRDGKIKYREHIIDGLENAPQALVDLFNGRNVGKLIVRIATFSVRWTTSGTPVFSPTRA